MELLKKELIKDLRQRPITAPKDADYTFTSEFMVYLYRQLYTYQTIGKEVLKEQIFEKRIALLKANEIPAYQEVLDNRQKGFAEIQMEIKDIVFDYFNLITKEYEMSYEKCRSDTKYQDEIAEIKKQVDIEYVDRKWDEVPAGLTVEKTREVIEKKQVFVN